MREFRKGKWVGNKTSQRFSSVPIDQMHEWTNKKIKSSGGLVGLFINYDARTKWLISSPKISEILDEFEQTLEGYSILSDDFEHHEESVAFQKTFYQKS